jgi:hypothetical protein
MRIRQVIDGAFAEAGVGVTPQVETDSVASLYAHVGAGDWASIVPHTWLRAMPVIGRTRAVRLLAPDAGAQISVATHAATPGSVTARAFVAAAQGLSLDEFFEQSLPTDLRSVCAPDELDCEVTSTEDERRGRNAGGVDSRPSRPGIPRHLERTGRRR